MRNRSDDRYYPAISLYHGFKAILDSGEERLEIANSVGFGNVNYFFFHSLPIISRSLASSTFH